MSSRRLMQSGFTIVELLMVIAIIGILIVVTMQVFSASYQGYFNTLENTLRTSEVSSAVQRTSRIIRGIHVITKAGDYELEGFAYLTPRDATLSKLRYYLNTTTKAFNVDVIPASGSAPSYNYNPADKKTYTILSNAVDTKPIFKYRGLDFSVQQFAPDAYKDIKAISINLSKARIKSQTNTPIEISTTVSIRPRKSNL